MSKFIILQGTNPGTESFPVVGNEDTVIYYDITDRRIKKYTNGPVSPVEPGWKKFTLSYSDFLTATGGTNVTISVGQNVIGAGSLVSGVKVKHSTVFSAVTLTTAATISILDESGTSHISTFNVFQAVGATTGAYTTGPNSSTVIPNHAVSTNLRARLVMSGIVADIHILTGITQGSVDVWVKTEGALT